MLRLLLERDRAAAALSLLVVAALGWAWLWRHAGMGMAPQFGYLALMWAVMMVAMMLPSAAPMILLYGLVAEREKQQGRSYVPTGLFAAAYLAVWTAVALAAAGLQAWLVAGGELSSRPANAALLIAAGIYQFTPLKSACLRSCRSPMQFILQRWRPGWRGAMRMGLEHAAYCVGCCWLLMGLLFVGGVMNLGWVVGIALYVLLEKLAPAGPWLGRAAGALLCAAGAALLLA